MCDGSYMQNIAAAEKNFVHSDDESEFDDDFAIATGKDIKSQKKDKGSKSKVKSENSGSEKDTDASISDDGISEMDDGSLEDEEILKDDADSFVDDISMDEDSQNESNEANGSNVSDSEGDEPSPEEFDDAMSDEEVLEKSKPDEWEDIYGRKRDAKGKIRLNFIWYSFNWGTYSCPIPIQITLRFQNSSYSMRTCQLKLWIHYKKT